MLLTRDTLSTEMALGEEAELARFRYELAALVLVLSTRDLVGIAVPELMSAIEHLSARRVNINGTGIGVSEDWVALTDPRAVEALKRESAEATQKHEDFCARVAELQRLEGGG